MRIRAALGGSTEALDRPLPPILTFPPYSQASRRLSSAAWTVYPPRRKRVRRNLHQSLPNRRAIEVERHHSRLKMRQISSLSMCRIGLVTFC